MRASVWLQFFVTTIAWVQQKNIPEMVSDNNTEPLPGVKVAVRGAIQGIITLEDGMLIF